MNTLILNRDTFQMPDDGWYQIAPVGEFPHSGAGVVQVVDRAACDAMVNTFQADALKPNFAGLLIDFDHFSLDGRQKSEAAGWIIALENRENGLWAKIRWSDAGEACVRGGRYRFISPVWARADCEDMGDGRVRPVRLMNAALTNDPNLKGMVPLSNRKTADYRPQTADSYNAGGLTTESTEDTKGVVANTAPAVRLKWVLGGNDRNCPSCAGLAGQVHSEADWDAAGLRPGAGALYCQGNCHCSLVETDEPESGELSGVPIRKEEVLNREMGKTED